MRIAWLTPLNRRCGISKFTLAAVPALADLADVEVWSPSTDDDYALPSAAVRELRADEAAVRELAAFDAVVLNAGNNPAFHAEIAWVSERIPGIVVVHDKRMHGFYFETWAVVGGEPERYAAMMRYYYGRDGERFAAEVLASRANVDSDARFPLIEPAIFNAEAIVVHSAEAAALADRYPGLVPVRTLGLPFALATAPDATDLPTREQLAPRAGKRALLVSSGGVYEQKRLESVVRAIASSPALRESVYFAVVGGGRTEYVARLSKLARELGVEHELTFTGFVDDREMYGWLAAADIAVNLRYPSMESASLSLLEQLSFGAPAVVSDTSYYSELPQEIAVKVPVGDEEVPALAVALESLVSDTARRSTMGVAAREYVARCHDPAAYAAEIVRLASEVVEARGAAS